MGLYQILDAKRSYKQLQKVVNKYNKTISKTHKAATTYHLNKLMNELSGHKADNNNNTFTCFYGSDYNRISAVISLKDGKIQLDKTINVYYEEKGIQLVMV